MPGQRAKEGYLLIDTRHAPPPDATAIARTGKDVATPGGAVVYESATYTCSHCSAIVVINLRRTRERAWCWKCDHVICDPCSLLPCTPMARRLEQGQTEAVRSILRGRL